MKNRLGNREPYRETMAGFCMGLAQGERDMNPGPWKTQPGECRLRRTVGEDPPWGRAVAVSEGPDRRKTFLLKQNERCHLQRHINTSSNVIYQGMAEVRLF